MAHQETYEESVADLRDAWMSGDPDLRREVLNTLEACHPALSAFLVHELYSMEMAVISGSINQLVNNLIERRVVKAQKGS